VPDPERGQERDQHDQADVEDLDSEVPFQVVHVDLPESPGIRRASISGPALTSVPEPG
jgi:hypothetical protein